MPAPNTYHRLTRCEFSWLVSALTVTLVPFWLLAFLLLLRWHLMVLSWIQFQGAGSPAFMEEMEALRPVVGELVHELDALF
jgi:hypothetical protein